MKKVLLFILSFFFLISGTIAEEGDGTSEIPSETEKEAYTVKDLGEVSFSTSSGTGSAPRIELTNSSGEKITAWCKDPYAKGITSDAVYYEKTDVDPAALAQYQSIYDQTCGDEAKQAAAVRTTAVKLNDLTDKDGSDSAEARYGGLGNKNVKYGTTDDENTAFQNILSNAENASVTNKNKVTKTQINSTTTIITSDEKINTGSSYCKEEDLGDRWRTTCTLPEDYCNPGDGSGAGDPVEIPIGDGVADSPIDSDGDGNIDCTPCQVKVFYTKTATSVQEFVACVDSNGNSRGAGGKSYNKDGNNLTAADISGSGTDSDYGNITLDCTDSYDIEKDCEPFVDNLEDYGSYICYPNGATVISVDEQLHEEEENILNCIINNPLHEDVAGNPNDATTIFFPAKENQAYTGDDYTAAHDLSLCNIYCTEDYEMKLPGPTADKLSGEVMVNAGTFFTVDGGSEINNITTVDCYLKQDYKNLIKAIDLQRKKTAEAYTLNEKKKAAEKGFSAYYTEDGCAEELVCTTDPDTGEEDCECPSYYWKYNWKKSAYTTYSLTLTGTEYSANYIPGTDILPNGRCEGTGKYAPSSCNEKDKKQQEIIKDTTERLNKLGGTLDAIVGKAENYINDAYTTWEGICTEGWNFDKINDAIYKKESCQTNLTFWYEELNNFKGIDESGKEIIPEVKLKSTSQTPKGEDKELIEDASGPHEPKTGLCTESGPQNKSKSTKRYKYVKQTETSTATYELISYFCNPYNDSEVPFFCGTEDECKTKCTAEGAGGKTSGTIIRGFPVGLETPQGKYSYRYDYNGIGHYFDGNCFRSVNSVNSGRLEKIIEHFDSSLDETALDNTCVYSVNNCVACGVRCIDKGDGVRYGCDVPFKVCGAGCKIACVGGGCILDINAGFLVTYRTISLNNPFPNDTAFLESLPSGTLALLFGGYVSPTTSDVSSTQNFPGSNWDTAKGVEIKNSWTSSLSEEIYNSNPSYTFTLDPGKISDIRDYNAASDEGYSDKSKLICEKYEGADYSICQSPFIDAYADEDKISRVWVPWTDTSLGEFTGPAYK